MVGLGVPGTSPFFFKFTPLALRSCDRDPTEIPFRGVVSTPSHHPTHVCQDLAVNPIDCTNSTNTTAYT